MKYRSLWPAIICTIFCMISGWVPQIHSHEMNPRSSKKENCPSHLEPGSPICELQQVITAIDHSDDYTPLLEKASKAQFVLIGDSTHGSHEFYQERINISKRLITEKNFRLIAIEGSWPQVYQLNQYIHSHIPQKAIQVLEVFNQYPDWVWKNTEMLDFIRWLRDYNNQNENSKSKVSLYGIDVYNSKRSQGLVVEYLKKFFPKEALLAQQRYDCFLEFDDDIDQYAQAVRNDSSRSCESKVIQQYRDFMDCRIPCPDSSNGVNRETFFQAQQNALNVKNTEQYYRILYSEDSDAMSWNIRDQHMLESLKAQQRHLNNPKSILWAHSSHLGNALATDMAKEGKLNVGQLLRQHYPNQVFSVGMLTYAGQVVASDNWDAPAKVMSLLPAHPKSNVAIFHQLGVPRFFLLLQQQPFGMVQWLNSSRWQRHVGVMYLPDEEIDAHYSQTHLVDEFDAIVYIDITTPLSLLSTK